MNPGLRELSWARTSITRPIPAAARVAISAATLLP